MYLCVRGCVLYGNQRKLTVSSTIHLSGIELELPGLMTSTFTIKPSDWRQKPLEKQHTNVHRWVIGETNCESLYNGLLFSHKKEWKMDICYMNLENTHKEARYKQPDGVCPSWNIQTTEEHRLVLPATGGGVWGEMKWPLNEFGFFFSLNVTRQSYIFVYNIVHVLNTVGLFTLSN